MTLTRHLSSIQLFVLSSFDPSYPHHYHTFPHKISKGFMLLETIDYLTSQGAFTFFHPRGNYEETKR